MWTGAASNICLESSISGKQIVAILQKMTRNDTNSKVTRRSKISITYNFLYSDTHKPDLGKDMPAVT